jgi:uncharacterized membrane protein YtjA (UPF0391 family)
MLNLAIVFLVIALIAGALGLTGVAGDLASIAWILFIIFIVLFVASFVLNMLRGRGTTAQLSETSCQATRLGATASWALTWAKRCAAWPSVRTDVAASRSS